MASPGGLLLRSYRWFGGFLMTLFARCSLLVCLFFLIGCDRAEKAIAGISVMHQIAFESVSYLFRARRNSSGWGNTSCDQEALTPGIDHLRSRYVVPIPPEGWSRSESVPLCVSFDSHREYIAAEREALKRALSQGRIYGISGQSGSDVRGLARRFCLAASGHECGGSICDSIASYGADRGLFSEILKGEGAWIGCQDIEETQIWLLCEESVFCYKAGKDEAYESNFCSELPVLYLSHLTPRFRHCYSKHILGNHPDGFEW